MQIDVRVQGYLVGWLVGWNVVIGWFACGRAESKAERKRRYGTTDSGGCGNESNIGWAADHVKVSVKNGKHASRWEMGRAEYFSMKTFWETQDTKNKVAVIWPRATISGSIDPHAMVFGFQTPCMCWISTRAGSIPQVLCG